MTGLYLHVPFRRHAIPFAEEGVQRVSRDGRRRYVEAVRQEIRTRLDPRGSDRGIRTVHVGGGRPSLLSPAEIEGLWEALSSSIDLSGLEEVTFKLHPSDASPSFLQLLTALGVSRLSMEIVSWSTRTLSDIGIEHTPEEARIAVQQGLDLDVQSVSVDLAFGLPGQSQKDWNTSLNRTVVLGVPHVSLVESPAQDPGPQTRRADQLERAMTVLLEAGYEQYGMPHFAKPGHRSTHQENYYRHGPYVGIGLSAESFRWRENTSAPRARRRSNVASMDAYTSALKEGTVPVAKNQTLDATELAQEYVLLRLQTRRGLDLAKLHQRYNVELTDQKADVIDHLVENDLIYDIDGRIQLTPRGRLRTDAVTRRLLPQTGPDPV